MTEPTATPAVDNRPVVISWVPDHGRSRGIAALIEGDAVFMPWAQAGQPRWRSLIGYVRSAVHTIRAVRERPGRLVVVMVPPVFSVLAALAAARRSRDRIVVDVHSGAFNDPRWRWSHRLLRWLLSRSRLVMVTNRRVLDGVDLPVDVLVLHDPPVSWLGRRLEDSRRHAATFVQGPESGRYVLFPASGGWDEPMDAVLEAARLLAGDGIRVVVSGRVALPEGPVEATGYLARPAYEELLSRASVVLALTTREATMQRAAYEGLDAGRPLVCSDTVALREAFGDAAVYSRAEGAALRAAVLKALESGSSLVERGRAVSGRFEAQAAAAREVLLAIDRSSANGDMR